MAEHDPLTATTLTELMRRRAAVSPETPYFHLYGETVTYGRLWTQSARYAAGLAAHGVRPGDKVCLIYPTCAEFFYTFFGAVRLGAVPVPLYHDMGLIGLSFTPPLMAAPVWLLPPDLRNPRQWLELMTQVRATFTVSPDFGYRNCVRNVRDTHDLDLSSLKAALSGAEPVRLWTIRGFEGHFRVKNVIAPCYGLAEATLAVAVWPRGQAIRVDATGRFVSAGYPCRGVSVRIVPRAGDGPPVALAANAEGEIQVKGPGVMKGYYNN